MGSEIEAKVRITDAPALRRALEKLGAEYRGAWLETDTFFDHPERRLMEHDSALRLRRRRPLDDVAGQIGASSLLTYKGPRRAGRMKVRTEHQVEVPDPVAMSDILCGLDYRETFTFEKRRRVWRVQCAEVTLDEVPRLGTFAEVEAAREDEVVRLLDALGLGRAEATTDSYVQMLLRELGGRADGQHVGFEETG
jgi:adenylate cyclase class 2